MRKMCGRFPGSVVVRVTDPFDKVFAAVVTLAVVQDAFDFEFDIVVDSDRVWGRHQWRSVREGTGSQVGPEDGDVEDRVNLEGDRKVKFVGNRRDLLHDSVGPDESVLELPGRSAGLGCKVDVCGREENLVTDIKLDITSGFVSISLLVSFSED